MKGLTGTLARAVADFLMPRECIVCGCRLNIREEHICLKCQMEMPLTYFWKQTHNNMADRFNDVIQKNIADGKERYAYAAALFFYREESPYRKISYQIKYKGDVRTGVLFGRMLGCRLKEGSHFKDIDWVLPVPLHWTRRLKRGYNQAEIIAKAVAKELGAEMRTDVLTRRKKTTTQTKLDIESKAANVKDAFAIARKGKGIGKTDRENIGKTDRESTGCTDGRSMPSHILLIDDIFTTGSTALACFLALRTVFPPGVRISIATLGCVV